MQCHSTLKGRLSGPGSRLDTNFQGAGSQADLAFLSQADLENREPLTLQVRRYNRNKDFFFLLEEADEFGDRHVDSEKSRHVSI